VFGESFLTLCSVFKEPLPSCGGMRILPNLVVAVNLFFSSSCVSFDSPFPPGTQELNKTHKLSPRGDASTWFERAPGSLPGRRKVRPTGLFVKPQGRRKFHPAASPHRRTRLN
jgi:hypothetical protein